MIDRYSTCDCCDEWRRSPTGDFCYYHDVAELESQLEQAKARIRELEGKLASDLA